MSFKTLRTLSGHSTKELPTQWRMNWYLHCAKLILRTNLIFLVMKLKLAVSLMPDQIPFQSDIGFFFLYLAPSIQKLSKTVDCHIFFLVCTLLFWGFNVFFCLSEQTFVTIRYRWASTPQKVWSINQFIVIYIYKYAI